MHVGAPPPPSVRRVILLSSSVGRLATGPPGPARPVPARPGPARFGPARPDARWSPGRRDRAATTRQRETAANSRRSCPPTVDKFSCRAAANVVANNYHVTLNVRSCASPPCAVRGHMRSARTMNFPWVRVEPIFVQ